MILAILDLQVTPMLPSNWPFGSGEEAKIDFQDGGHGGHLGFPIGSILAIFDLQCFLASLVSIGLSVQEKKRKIDFQDGGPGGHLGFPIGKILAIFDLQVTPMLPSKFGVNWPIVQEKKRKIDVQDDDHGGHLGFSIGTILAFFDLQVTPMLPSKYRVNWPFGSGEKAKNRFSRWLPLRPSWNFDRHDFSYF